MEPQSPSVMSDAQILAGIREVLRQRAPETDFQQIRMDEPLRDQVDLDSMDFYEFMMGLYKTFHVDIPESDYARLSSLGAIVNYLKRKLGMRNG